MKTQTLFIPTRQTVLYLCLIGLISIGYTACQKENIPINKQVQKTDLSAQASNRMTTEFCMMTYNTFLLDAPDISGPQCEGEDCHARAFDICRYISESNIEQPDIVTFQEVFEVGACNTLVSCMEANGYAFHTGCDIATFNNPLDDDDCFCEGIAPKGSGLITFSKFPITETEFEVFEDSHGCISDGSDCAADKGILLTNIDLGEGCIISVVNTHVDAGEDDGSIEARRLQFSQISAFLNQHVPADQSMFFGGDFNIHAGNFFESGFRDLLNITATYTLAGSNPGVTAGGGQVLDYIFVKEGDDDIINTSYTVVTGVAGTVYCYWTLSDDWFQLNVADFAHHYEVINGVPHEPYAPGYRPTQPEQIGQWFSYDDIHPDYIAHVEEHCVQGLVENPSDHNPVLSCFTYNCDEEVIDDDVIIYTDPECDNDHPCPDGEHCVKGKCQPF